VAIDRAPVAYARLELQIAARQAVNAIQHSQGWSQKDIARRCHQPESSLKRLLGNSEDSVAEQVCSALDDLCKHLQLGPFHLAELRQAWSRKLEQARHGRQEPHPGRIRVGIPAVPAVALQPRAALVEQIAAATGAADHAVLQSVAFGDGGVGKTQLARAVWDQADDTLPVMVWVNAIDRSTIITSYAQAAEAVESVPEGYQDSEEAAQLFLAWLAQTWMSWLIVLDDVRQDLGAMRGLWPPHTSTGRTVITTRRTDLLLPRTAQIPVGIYTPTESLDYLRERFDTDPRARADCLDGAAELAEALGHLPLALTQAASYIARRARTCTTYLQEFTDQRAKVPDLFPEIDAADSYAHTVATTWALAINAADELAPTGLAGPALELAAFLDAAGAPETIWTCPVGRRYLHQSSSDAAGKEARDPSGEVSPTEALDALRNLHLFSVITHTPGRDGRAGRVAVHNLVQRVTRESLPNQRRGEAIQAAADAITGLWPRIARGHLPWVANATALLSYADEVLIDQRVHPLYFRYAPSLAEAGQLAAATTVLAPVLAAIHLRLGPSHPDTLAVRGNLANWRGEAGDPGGAAAEFEQLLSDQLRVLGPDHPDSLSTRNNLAAWRGEAGDPGGAAAEFEQLLSDQLRVLGPDHPDIVITRGNIAGWRGQAGDPAGAAAAFEQLLSDQLRVLGPDHPNTLITRNNLAVWRGYAGDAAGAAAAFEQVLSDQLRVLGPDHPKTLITRNNLAYWRGRAGDPAGAAEATHQLLIDRLRVLGPDHPDTLITRGNLAAWRGLAGDPAGAAEATGELLSDQLRVLGPDHPETLATRGNLAYWRGHAGDPVGAAEATGELLSDRLRVLGPDHPDTLVTRNNLAYWRGHAGDPVGAAAAFEQLLSDRLRVLGPDHPDTLATRNNLAYRRGEAGDPAGAAAAFEQLLSDQLRVLGPDHPETLVTRNNLAHSRGEAGDPAGAAEATDQLLSDRLRVLGPDHPDTLATRNNLAYWRGEAGDPAGAAAAFEQLLSDQLRVLGPDHPHIVSTRNNLAYWRGNPGAQ
jgi:hypothetical protein